MADVLNELKNLSETLQNQNTTLPKAHTFSHCVYKTNRFYSKLGL